MPLLTPREKEVIDRLKKVDNNLIHLLEAEDQVVAYGLIQAGILRLGAWKDKDRVWWDRARLSDGAERIIKGEQPPKQNRLTRWVMGSLIGG